MRRGLVILAAAGLLWSGTAIAGTFSNFETQLRNAYGDYRVALFATNSGDASKAAAALAKFDAEWAQLAGQPAPPQYEDDSRFAETMRVVGDLSRKASDEVGAGALPKAHETLEKVRDEIGEMHLRAGLYTVSDRMNAYHRQMERVIGNKAIDARGAGEGAAVLSFLIDDIIAHPPVPADPAFQALAADARASVDKLKSAAQAGDMAAISAAITGLKPAYSKLFLKFG
ncbi:hypothetical protein [Rhizobium sp. C4]|uniref:hypothetical protein n=1 Tax=Rhizobium sp. C4 TaxID=1349800 RepID=UPI001E4DDBC8|nr:hypothetical protein [Rhizobium sp. C4]MCD2172839.1 hypothetical protein [Rhizobium sp. C4]